MRQLCCATVVALALSAALATQASGQATCLDCAIDIWGSMCLSSPGCVGVPVGTPCGGRNVCLRWRDCYLWGASRKCCYCVDSITGPPTPYVLDIPNGTGEPLVTTVSSTEYYHIGELYMRLAIEHDNIGDLVITVEHDDGTGPVAATLLNRPGYDPVTNPTGCTTNLSPSDSLLLFTSEGTIAEQCAAWPPEATVAEGAYGSEEPLDSFVCHETGGEWTLRVWDMNPAGETGAVHGWTYVVPIEASPVAPISWGVVKSIYRRD